MTAALRHTAADSVHAASDHRDRTRGDGDARRSPVDALLHPLMLAGTAGAMTMRGVAERGRDAAEAVLPLLGEPRRSADRVRRLLVPVLCCPWADFDAAYAAALDAVLALPPALAGVVEPAWDADLAPPAPVRRRWVEQGMTWEAPAEGAEATGPAGTPGKVARRGRQSVVVTADGREVRLSGRCGCELPERRARTAVPFEHVHLRRDGSILDVTVGTACGACRAPID